MLADRGRLVDLIVVARGNGTGPDLVETALFDTGAAVLVAPPLAPRPFDGAAIVGWNGSAQASRAIARAIPFLARAASVAVLTADDGAEGRGEKGQGNSQPTCHFSAPEVNSLLNSTPSSLSKNAFNSDGLLT